MTVNRKILSLLLTVSESLGESAYINLGSCRRTVKIRYDNDEIPYTFSVRICGTEPPTQHPRDGAERDESVSWEQGVSRPIPHIINPHGS